MVGGHHSQEEAEHWQNKIYRKIHSLSDFPFSHSLADENPDFSYELREALFGLGSRPGYRILFTIVEQTIHVLAVRAAQEDVIIPDELFPPGQTEQESG